MSAPGYVVREHEIEVPLDHADPTGAQISVFAREVAREDGGDRPWLLFLQGGPGDAGPRPTTKPLGPGWLERATADHRVLLLDDRGTGRSTPIGDLPGTPQEQASYLTHFRADAIVQDAERLREHLGAEQWSVLGQSFGGFCALHYLCVAPGSLREAFFTGGVPPIGHSVDEVYAATYDVVRERNRLFHEAFPDDRARLERLLDLCDEGRVTLPGGVPVSARRVRQLGSLLGMSDGPENLHHLLELDPLSSMFRYDLANALPFSGRHPIYTVLHESCYADGGTTGWSAERVMPDDFREDRTLLTGEHALPWYVTEDPDLAPYAAAADLLAAHSWPRLYDEQALVSCTVPAAAAVYVHDPYVLRTFSEETAALVPSLRTWVTDAYEHNGLRADGGKVLDTLFGLVR